MTYGTMLATREDGYFVKLTILPSEPENDYDPLDTQPLCFDMLATAFAPRRCTRRHADYSDGTHQCD